MPTQPIATKLLVRRKHFGANEPGAPYVSEGDSARVLFFMNLSGAYNGYSGVDQAQADATLFAAAPALLAALNTIHSWLVCAAIASPEDMAQSFPDMERVASQAIAQAEGRGE